jgi:hypothetical protein
MSPACYLVVYLLLSADNGIFILSHVWSVTIYGDWIASWIYSTLWYHVTTLYMSLLQAHSCPQSRLHCCSLVVASVSWHSPSSGFLNCPGPQLLLVVENFGCAEGKHCFGACAAVRLPSWRWELLPEQKTLPATQRTVLYTWPHSKLAVPTLLRLLPRPCERWYDPSTMATLTSN